MNSEEVDKLANQNKSRKTKLMLETLARYLRGSTEIIKVPDGTKIWILDMSIPDKTTELGYVERQIEIKLEPFFGLMAGYNLEFGIFVFWKGA